MLSSEHDDLHIKTMSDNVEMALLIHNSQFNVFLLPKSVNVLEYPAVL